MFSAEVCGICMDELQAKPGESLLCGHAFHCTCIGAWFDFKGQWQCPMCRAAISTRRIAHNSTYTVLLRIDTEAPWQRILDALPQTPAFLALASKCCNTPTLRGMWMHWYSATLPALRDLFQAKKIEFGTRYFFWDDTKAFKVEFMHGGVRYRVPISQLNFLCQAEAAGLPGMYEAFLLRPTASKLTPRRPPLITRLIALRMSKGVI